MPVEMAFGIAATVLQAPNNEDAAMRVVSAASWAHERVDLFGPIVAEEGAAGSAGTAHRFHGTDGWSKVELVTAAEPLIASEATSACSWGEGRLDLVGPVRLKVDDGGWASGIGHTYFDAATGWGRWDFLGGPAEGSPRVVTWGAGRLDVFCWADDNCFHQWFDSATGWSSWESVPELRLPDRVYSLVVVAPAPGVIDIFGASSDQADEPAPAQPIGNAGAMIPDPNAVLTPSWTPERYVWDGLWHAGYRADGPITGWFGWEQMAIPGIDGERFWTVTAVPDVDSPDAEIVGVRDRPRPRSAVLIAGIDLIMKARYDGANWVAAPVAARGKYFRDAIACSAPRGSRNDLFLNKVDGPGIYHYWSNDAGETYQGPEQL